MMKLKNMIMDTDAVAIKALQHWDYDKDTLEFWRASSNFIYRFCHNGKEKFLRLSYQEDSCKEQMVAELELLGYLLGQGFCCAAPVKSKGDSYIEPISTDRGVYYGVVFEGARGKRLDNIKAVSQGQLEEWGKALASFHNLSMDFKPSHKPRKSWRDVLLFAKGVLAKFPEERVVIEELERMENWLNSLPITSHNYGLIHYDFQRDNVFWDEDRKTYIAIDFDDAMYHWYVMDIVCVMEDLEEIEEDGVEGAYQSFLDGYCSVRNIDEELLSLIPGFKKFDSLYKFARLMRSLEDSDKIEKPEWAVALRNRLLKSCHNFRGHLSHQCCNHYE